MPKLDPTATWGLAPDPRPRARRHDAVLHLMDGEYWCPICDRLGNIHEAIAHVVANQYDATKGDET